MVGLVDAIYLSWEKVTQNQAMCLPGLGDCRTVNTSKYSEIFGIPVAFVGVISYLFILVLLLIEKRNQITSNYAPMFVFGLSLTGVIFSGYLTYLEIFVIKAICPFCVVSAIVMLAVFILTSVRILKSEL